MPYSMAERVNGAFVPFFCVMLCIRSIKAYDNIVYQFEKFVESVFICIAKEQPTDQPFDTMAALSKEDSEGHLTYTGSEDSEPLSLTLQSMQSDDVSSFSSSALTVSVSMRSEMEDSEALQLSLQSTRDNDVFNLTAYSGVADEEWSEDTEREIALLKSEAKRHYTISDDSFDSQALMESLTTVMN
ncbi:hypothetical protein T4D_1877 [Trichinella pseudospiralis]|uniref:Uncharacterized protein n=1 Tax=Trichinella pseudospiralis TaxID=6337 RepID=A0A0V1FL03_TRIPS|nr:hypothetical protein T4D_1877 [Trichinella pseudospiralis]